MIINRNNFKYLKIKTIYKRKKNEPLKLFVRIKKKEKKLPKFFRPSLCSKDPKVSTVKMNAYS